MADVRPGRAVGLMGGGQVASVKRRYLGEKEERKKANKTKQRT